jgi:hypothetical protein
MLAPVNGQSGIKAYLQQNKGIAEASPKNVAEVVYLSGWLPIARRRYVDF